MLTVYQACTWDHFALGALKCKISDKDDPHIPKDVTSFTIFRREHQVFSAYSVLECFKIERTQLLNTTDILHSPILLAI